MTDPYKVLGLTQSATVDEIKTAYRKLAMKYHPDRNDGKDEKFKEVGEAYEKIKDGPPKYKGPTFGDAGRSTADCNFKTDDIINDVRNSSYREEDFNDNLSETLYKHTRTVRVSAQTSLVISI